MTTIMVTNKIRSDFNNYLTNNDDYVWNNKSVSRNDIKIINFIKLVKKGRHYCDNNKKPITISNAWDVSAAGDNSIIAWQSVSDKSILNIGCTKVIEANPDSMFMFAGFNNLTEINFNDMFTTSLVKDMKGFFSKCYRLVSLNLRGFDTQNVTRMEEMFENCSSLKQVDVSSFCTDNVKNMARMFTGCENLLSLDLSNFRTDNLEDMCGMFSLCNSLISVDLSNFNTKNVTDFDEAFCECKNLSNLDLTSFDFSNATTSDMFWGTKWEKEQPEAKLYTT